MTRANIYIRAYEGFKLGGLGVSKIPKTVSPGVQHNPSPQKTKIWNFKNVTDYSWIWKETVTENWLFYFEKYIHSEPDLKTWCLYVSFSIIDPVPRLKIKLMDNIGIFTDALGDFIHKHVRFQDQESKIAFISARKKLIESSGIDGLGFPEYWKREW
jgi:hypothetical protein